MEAVLDSHRMADSQVGADLNTCLEQEAGCSEAAVRGKVLAHKGPWLQEEERYLLACLLKTQQGLSLRYR